MPLKAVINSLRGLDGRGIHFDLISTTFTIWGGHSHHQMEISNKSSKSNTKHSDFEIDTADVSDLW